MRYTARTSASLRRYGRTGIGQQSFVKIFFITNDKNVTNVSQLVQINYLKTLLSRKIVKNALNLSDSLKHAYLRAGTTRAVLQHPQAQINHFQSYT